MKKRILLMLILIALTSKAQQCSPYHDIKNYEYNDDVEFSISYGYCFHYNSFAFQTMYDNIALRAVIMSRSRRMPNMTRETYLVGGYQKVFGVGAGWSTKGLVVYSSLDLKIIKHINANVVFYQTNYNMSHIVVGLKITY